MSYEVLPDRSNEVANVAEFNMQPPEHTRAEQLLAKIETYDIASPEAEHLRSHQVEFVQSFISQSRAILKGDAPNQGMCLLHPTGSGKTVGAAEVARMFCSGETDIPPTQRALILVPSHQILNQAAGTSEDMGAIRTYAPGITVAEYSGRRKDLDAAVTVMSYQSLGGAIKRGDIEKINPSMVICDEIHHVIDGAWAKDVQEISQGRLLLGMTATPTYSEIKDVRKLFPTVLAHKTLKEGIEEGILSEMRGFVYQGYSKMHVTGKSKDYRPEDIFAMLSDSRDNYLAAAICAGEVSQGRRGVVSCAPGFDRAHAKIMAKILSHTPVSTPEGKRNINAAYVDGETHEDSLIEIFDKYNRGQIDVITYTDLLLEGWDSPETEFGVMLRPTKSRVLAEQRIGRVVRPLEGKTATIHEIVYDIVGDNKPQVTHLDILDSEDLIQGNFFGKSGKGSGNNNPEGSNGRRPRSYGNIFNVDQFVVDSGLIAEMTGSQNLTATQNSAVGWVRETVPYNWRTSQVLSSIFDIPRDEIEQILQENEVISRTQTTDEISRTYYSPNATRVVAKSLGIEELPEGEEHPMTINDLTEYYRNHPSTRRLMPKTIERLMDQAGIIPGRYINASNHIVNAYPYESKDAPITALGQIQYRAPEQLDEALVREIPGLEVANWLGKVLVSPKSAESIQQERWIVTGQGCLLAAIRERRKKDDNPDVYERLAGDIARHEVEPTEQMKNVMGAKDLDFVELVMIASRAKNRFDQIQAVRLKPNRGSVGQR